MRSTARDADVAVVGAGPVGLLTALLLGNSGHQVAVVERWPTPYGLPRATGLTHEILRCLQAARIMDNVSADILFTADGSRHFEMRAGTGEVLTVRVDQPTSASGWPERASFSQPRFERTVDAIARTHPNIQMLRGWSVTGVSEDAVVTAVPWTQENAGTLQVNARYVVGCDGANSVVRTGELAATEDLGFAHDWLVADVIVPEDRVITPHLAQIFGPPRPTTLVSGGPGGRRRWEFMRLPGESVQELNRAETVWRLLAPYDVRPDNAELERHAVYTFNGRWSLQWRAGRRVIAGDAAHLMPVFLGEGFNSGIRDAAAIAWRLDLILRGLAPDDLLDSYASERLGHVRQVVEQAVEAGKMICLLDPQLAAERDARLRAGPSSFMPEHKRRGWRLGPGVWRADDPHAGFLGVQGRVEVDGRNGLFDDVIAHRGFVLLAVDGDPRKHLSPRVRAAWDAIGGICAHIGPNARIADLDDTYAEWFAARGIGAILVRPDFYVFGAAASASDVDALATDFLRRIGVLNPAETR